MMHTVIIPKRSKTQETGTTLVGIPRAMMYYEHGELWEKFFRCLGCGVIFSGDTNKKTLNDGVRCCNNENCLPVKVMTGHALELLEKTDTIFIPRYKSIDKMEFTCPKFCGLPDMVRLNLKGRANILEVVIDYDKGMADTQESLKKLSDRLKVGYGKTREAFFEIVKDRLRPDMEAADMEPVKISERTVAVLGHPYVVQDDFISMGVSEKIRKHGYHVIKPSDLGRAVKMQNTYPKVDFFYGVGYDILGSAFALAHIPEVKGLVYLSTFSCGLDAILTEYIERHLREISPVPYLKLTIDEHTGEAGFDTRLEAFLDMVGAGYAVGR